MEYLKNIRGSLDEIESRVNDPSFSRKQEVCSERFKKLLRETSRIFAWIRLILDMREAREMSLEDWRN